MHKARPFLGIKGTSVAAGEVTWGGHLGSPELSQGSVWPQQLALDALCLREGMQWPARRRGVGAALNISFRTSRTNSSWTNSFQYSPSVWQHTALHPWSLGLSSHCDNLQEENVNAAYPKQSTRNIPLNGIRQTTTGLGVLVPFISGWLCSPSPAYPTCCSLYLFLRNTTQISAQGAQGSLLDL